VTHLKVSINKNWKFSVVYFVERHVLDEYTHVTNLFFVSYRVAQFSGVIKSERLLQSKFQIPSWVTKVSCFVEITSNVIMFS
jgi:hypothetical protein